MAYGFHLPLFTCGYHILGDVTFKKDISWWFLDHGYFKTHGVGYYRNLGDEVVGYYRTDSHIFFEFTDERLGRLFRSSFSNWREEMIHPVRIKLKRIFEPFSIGEINRTEDWLREQGLFNGVDYCYEKMDRNLTYWFKSTQAALLFKLSSGF